MQLAEDLTKLVAGEVLTDSATLDAHSTDASIFRVRPSVVVAPTNSADVQAVVSYALDRAAHGEQVSVTARAAGTCMSGGSLTDSIQLDFTKHFTAIGEIGDSTVAVEPGVYFRDLEAELTKRNLLFPSYPASHHLCAVGGMLANNAGGEKSLTYGKTARWVSELSVVLGDGKEYVVKPLTKRELDAKMQLVSFEGDLYRRLYRMLEDNYDAIHEAKPSVSKNSSGYALWDVWNRETFDLTKLFVGSQGTLGIITRAVLKLVAPKKHSRLFVVFFKDLENLGDRVTGMLGFKPESLESFDQHTFRLAMRYFPSLLRHMGGNVLLLGLKFIPELFAVLWHGIPELMVLVEFTADDADELDAKEKAFSKWLTERKLYYRVERTAGEENKYWEIRRESFNLLRQKIHDKQTAPFIDDIVVRPETLAEFLPQLNQLLARYRQHMLHTVTGHIGDGNFHIIPLMNLHDPDARTAMYKLLDEVMALVLEFGGSTSGEHNDGLIRSHYVRKMYGDGVYHLFEEAKRICDPQGIFNPRKKVDADFQFAMEHIK